MKKQVAVVVPIYRPLNDKEQASLRQTARVLSAYPIVLLVPQGLDTAQLLAEYPALTRMEVSTEWLGAKNGIAGYNAMMMSAEFYDRFSDYEYILICHVDAWVFRDELSYWCNQGYDCVAAPWIKKHYNILIKPVLRTICKQTEKLLNRNNEAFISHLFLHGKVGNGGFSLRKVESFRQACQQYSTQIAQCLQEKRIPEDVFWAITPTGFSYPPLHEAIRFSFDNKPEICFRMSHGQLPFGCHGWPKPKHAPFWEKHLPVK